MPIVFLLNDGTFKIPLDIKSKSEGFSAKRITDLQAEIVRARQSYKDRYVGAYDYLEFKIKGKIVSMMSKYSYEDVWRMSDPEGKVKYGEYIALGFKDEGEWEERKILRLLRLLTTLQNRRGRKYIGGSSSKETRDLLHDCLLLSYAILFGLIEDGNKRKKAEKLLINLRKQFAVYPEAKNLDKTFKPLSEEAERRISKMPTSFLSKILGK